MKKVFGGFAVVALMICSWSASPMAAPKDEAAVRSAVIGFSAAWNQHDMTAFGKLFAVDADFVNVAGLWWKGRKEIQTQHAWTHGAIPIESEGFEAGARVLYGIFKASTLQLDSIEIRFLRSDVAVAHARWTLTGDTRAQRPRTGLLSFVLTRQDGEWLIAAAQNTEINRVVK
jgi:uncharacterized protein (TIGR02246 family)